MLRSGLTRLLTVGVLALLVPMSVASAQPALAANAGVLAPGDPAAMQLILAEQALLDLTNADRAANGLAPLQFDSETLAIARLRAERQLGTASLSHYDTNGDLIFAGMLAEAQLSYRLAGENLARAAVDNSIVTQLVENALMESPAHRKNILEPTFHRVAIGAASDGAGQITFAEVYRD